MRRGVWAALALACSAEGAAALQRIELLRALGGAGDEHGIGVAALADGCVVAGYVALDARTQAALLERLDTSGEIVWRHTFPGGDDAALWSVRELPLEGEAPGGRGGGFVAAGWSRGPRGDLDALCVRVSAAGDVLWTRTYEGPGDERLWSLDLAGDELLAAGESAAAGRTSALVLRIGLDGELRERRTHAAAEVERVFAIQCLPAGGYVLAGMAGSGPREGPGYDARIAAYDADGRAQWEQSFGGPGYDVAHDVERSADGRLHVVGYTDTGGEHGIDGFLLVLAADGAIERSHTYGSRLDDRVVHLELLADGACATVGYARDGDDWDVVVRTLERGGAATSEQRFGGDRPELGRSIAAAPDGTLVVVGHSRSYGPRERLLVIRLRLANG